MAQQSMLFELPPEVRNMIWRLAVVNEDRIDVTTFTNPHEPTLLATCKQIREEAIGIFYGENGFSFWVKALDLSYDELSRMGWLESLGKSRSCKINDFRIGLTECADVPTIGQGHTIQDPQLTKLTQSMERHHAWLRVISLVTQAHFEGARYEMMSVASPMSDQSAADSYRIKFKETGDEVLRRLSNHRL